MSKIINTILIFVVLSQITFSLFYSSEILTQNDQLYQNQQSYQKLKLDKQILEKKFYDLASLKNINQIIISQQNLLFIKETIKIQ